MSQGTLPLPGSEPWQPLRAGLVDVFYYDQEEFWFRDGRLLLRGNNGTGKSKVLALMLPFLLDGELSPHRVEPDADPKKRMEREPPARRRAPERRAARVHLAGVAACRTTGRPRTARWDVA